MIVQLPNCFEIHSAVRYAIFWNNLATEMDVIKERDFARFNFTMIFGGISYIEAAP